MSGYYKLAGLVVLVIIFMGIGLWLQVLKKRKAEAEGRKLRFEARHDFLTGLYNKNTFCKETEVLLNTHPELEFFLVRWDVDNFKVYNDLYTPEQGDVLLQNLAVLNSLPAYRAGYKLKPEKAQAGGNQESQDPAFRQAAGKAGNSGLPGLPALLLRYGYLGNDHFVFCLPSDRERILYLVKSLQQQVAATRDNFMLVARVGIYRVSSRKLSVAIMCDRALIALRSTKGSQLSTIAWYDEEMRSRIWEEQWLTSRMQEAMAEGRFEVWFQPVYNCATHKYAMVEALARWKDPERGLLLPGTFVSVFEKNGAISHLDTYVWEKALEWLHAWIGSGHTPLVVSVNLSRVDIYNVQLREFLLKLCDKYQVSRQLLSLEITESAYGENPARFVQVLQQLRQDGFLLAMDDFGSGYSSLNALKELPIHTLKLDLRFSAAAGDSASGKILQSLVQMAKWLGLSLIAEGTETAESALFLESLGCDYLQGFYFARPMPAAQLEAFLLKHGAARVEISPSQEKVFQVSDFWNPDNAVSTLFNSIAGAAAIVEYNGGRLQFLRLCPDFLERLSIPYFNLQEAKDDLISLIHPSDRENYLQRLEAAIQAGRESTWEFRLQPQGQSQSYWLRNSVHLIFKQDKRYMFFMLTENVTAQKVQVQDLEMLNGQLNQVLGYLPLGISIYRAYQGHFYERSYNQTSEYFRTGHRSGGRPLTNLMSVMTGEETLEAALYKYVYWEDLPQMKQQLQKWQQREGGSIVFRSLRFDGQLRYLKMEFFWLNLSREAEVSVSEDSQVQVAVGVFSDVTAQQEKETSALSLDGRYRALMEGTTSATFDYDVARDLVDCTYSGEAGRLWNKQIGRFRNFINRGKLLDKDDLPYFTEMLDYVSSRSGKGNFEFRADLGVGFRWYRAYYVSLSRQDGMVQRVIGRLEDIQADKDSSDSLQHKASEDMLTGAYNRINSELLINRELLKNPLARHSIIEIDVDDFKQVNDTLGHPTGDLVLQAVAEVLKKLGRWTDIVGRLGGDEFLIFLPELGSRRILVQKLEELIRESRGLQEKLKLDVPVTLSVGAVILKPGVCDFKEAFALVDKALYQAKNHGKNQYYLEE